MNVNDNSKMPLSTNCWKYLVLTFNVLFAMSAVVLFGVSGLLLYRLFVYRHFIGLSVQYPVILLLMMAIITCSVAWIGWRTANTMHYFHIVVAGVLIFLVVVIEFGCFVWALVVWDNVELDIKSNMMQYFISTMQEKEPNSVNALRWDRLHVQMQCCGVTGSNDYRLHSSQMPFSCCGQGPLEAPQSPYTPDCHMVFQRGCGIPLHKYVQEQLLITAATGLIACVLQSSGIFCTFFLASAITKYRRASMAISQRANTSARDSIMAAADDSLLSPTAPTHTLPKY